MKAFQKLTFIVCLPAAMLLLSAQASHAGSATWSLNPGSGDWNIATNWTPATVPNSPTDSATFAPSNITGVSLSAFTEVAGIVFNAGASAFTITASPAFTLTISGVGITNNSGITQNFVTAVDGAGDFGNIAFTNSATAGSLTAFTNNGSTVSGAFGAGTIFRDTSTAGNGTFTNNGATGTFGGGSVQFTDSSTAGNGTFTSNGGAVSGGDAGAVNFTNTSTAGNGRFTNNGPTASGTFEGVTQFRNTSTAGDGIFTNNGGFISGLGGGVTNFSDSSTAGDGTYTNNGGTVSGAGYGYTQFNNTSTAGNGTFTNIGAVSGASGGTTIFNDTSTAGNGTLITNDGSGGGGAIQFLDDSGGGMARVEIFGNGILDISLHNAPGITTGSIEGSGAVFLGANNLTVGSTSLDTTFSGVIDDGGAHGSFTKIGAGILTFEGGASNDHIADTVTLSIANGSIVNLNFSGNADAIGGLIVGGVAQPAGLYGSAASGAPNQLPEFAGTGIVLVGPAIISVTSATGRTGSPFNFQVATAGGTSATRLSATGLPPGLTADPVTGEISGTSTSDGTFLVTLTVTEAGLTNTATLELTFTSDLAVPVIVSPNSALLFPGLPFSYTIVAPTSDSSDPVTYTEIGLLPPGLGLDQTTGIISGTPLLSRGLLPTPSLAGGVVTNVQIFACNSTGCAAQGLFFLLPTGAANISTRLSVGTGDNVLIGGFITEGNAPLKLVVRGIGPTLPLAGVLANPYLELRDAAGAVIGMNDNWKDNLAGGSQEVAIETTDLAPKNDLESAILSVLEPGGYTAIMRGMDNFTGVGLVEVYNLATASLDVSSEAHLANISTRGNVQTDANVMIGGFINRGATPMKVLVRGTGPSLTPFGVSGALADPYLELRDADGALIGVNDNWTTDPTQKADIMATELAPKNALESAILLTLPVGEGAYTAVVSGANGTTGIGLVEAYFGSPCLGTSCP